ncbi:hypothetical protein BOTBODRAFT_40349 [Botryobasidium botryosum FD-172 SS1]|uniref:Transmembrane protein n=1 Tax=Botryobasidium botryosum (strain FD-172 SS1) TaxID=930990 RepID=A0A067NBW5_BOTB1|nr:hypothetical protein BOTBODRAFT_40349 [Botryobasidium botryosum FD-172 SS1]
MFGPQHCALGCTSVIDFVARQLLYLVVAILPNLVVLLPATKAIRKCAWAILVSCITAFGFQKNATLVITDGAALDAIVVACLTSGISFLLAILQGRTSRWLDDEHILSILVHIGAFVYLLVACTSFAVFVGLVTWSTTPYTFTRLCVACGSLTGILLLFVVSAKHAARAREGDIPNVEPTADPIGADLERGGAMA